MQLGGKNKTDRSLKLLSILLMTTALLLIQAGVPFAHAHAATGIGSRSDTLSTVAPSAIATHQISVRLLNTSVPIGSLSFEFCSNSPLPGTSCVAPSGLDTSGVALASQSGNVNFTVMSSTSNRIILTRPAQIPAGNVGTYVFNHVINPDAAGSYYIRIQSYTSTDATGADVESGGIAFSINPQVMLETTVPPYLTVCSSVVITDLDCSTANSFFIDLGEFSATKTSYASSQFVVMTNAGNGYGVTLSGTTLTSGNNVIPALSVPTASIVGQPQFGINLRANSSPAIGSDPNGYGIGTVSPAYAQPNKFTYNAGDVVAQAVSPDYEKYTISYITNINSGQPAGIYATTITIICLANF